MPEEAASLQETTRGLETGIQKLKKLSFAETFPGVELDWQKIEALRESLERHAPTAITSIGPEFLVESLWPQRIFEGEDEGEGIGEDVPADFPSLQAGEAKYEDLRPLDKWWAVLGKEVKKVLGSGAVSEDVVRASLGKTRQQQHRQEGVEALETMATVRRMDLHFQEIEETFPETLTNYWEALLVIAKKLDVKEVSLHTPFLKNLNLEGRNWGQFNLGYMVITGFIPETEATRMEAEYIDGYLAVNEEVKLSVSERARVIAEMFPSWLAGEKADRAETTTAAIERQIAWFKAMKQKHGLEGGQMVVHFASIGDEGEVVLAEGDFKRGIENLKRLKALAGDEVELLVETQGLSEGQLTQLLNDPGLPNQRMVFDIAHVRMERRRYGDLFAALERYKDKIGIIHFSQPTQVGEAVSDTHSRPHEPGVFSDKEKARILQFADEHKIWVTFESGFGPKDLDKVLEWYGEEATTASD